MKITRAVITAASRDDRHLPLQRLVDRDGTQKAAIQIIVEEAVSAGAHEVAIAVRPADEPAFGEAAGTAASRLELIPQAELRGYGDAVSWGRAWAWNSSAASTTSPRARGSPSRPTCSPP